MHELNAMLAVIKDQVFRKENGRRLKLTRFYVGAVLSCLLPCSLFVAVVAEFVSLHLVNDAGMRDRHRAIFHEDLIPIGVENGAVPIAHRSEEHTSELQSRLHLV